MPSKAETLARRLVTELYWMTGGRAQQWRMLAAIEQRPGFDEASTRAALLSAAERDWILVDTLAAKGEALPHSVALTEQGLRAAG
jgi:hypothetical protein